MLSVAAGSALATDRYVDSGASCPGSGTSGSPYCSFSSVNSLDLAPGDRVLLKRGATFNVSTGPSLTLGDEDDGSSVSWNSVEPYGSGARPIITGASAANTKAINGTNLDYWRFSDIEFKNANESILITYTTLNHTGIRINNNYFHDTNNGSNWGGHGVAITIPSVSPPVPGPTQWILKDVQLTDNQFGNVGMAIFFDAIYASKLQSYQDFVILRNWLHDIVYDNGFRFATNVKWIGNRHERIASAALPFGNTDLHLWGGTNVTFVNNIFDFTYDAGTWDQTFHDIAWKLDQLRYRNNLIEDAAGPGVEWQVWRTSDENGLDSPPNYYSNQEVSGNVFRNNGWDTTPQNPNDYEGGLSYVRGGGSCGTMPTGTVSNNLSWEPTGFFNVNGCSQTMTLTNNLSVSASGDISYAAQIFSDAGCSTSPWSYESSTNGTSWTAMSTLSTVVAGTDVRCIGAGVPWVSRFEQYPNTGTSYTVARTWTAPSTGTVSIRGRALKAELGGDGVTVRVTKNAAAIIGPTSLGASDQVGVVLNADSVSVNAGDKIRFEVDDGASNTSDRVSWAPAVAYTSYGGGGSTTYIASSGFSGTQGANQWYYKYAAVGVYTYTNLANYDSTNSWWEYSTSQPPWLLVASSWQHPDNDDSVRTWVAPQAGTAVITNNPAAGNVRLNQTPNDGTDVYILKNADPIGSAIWSASILDQTGVVEPERTVTVAAGDQLHFRVNKRSNFSNDSTLWDPKVVFTPSGGGTTYIASTGFSGTQGANQWSYKKAAIGVYSYSNMASYDATNSWWEESTSQPPWTLIASSWQHPGGSNDSVRTWTAPSAGSVTVTSNSGNVRLNQTPNDGTTASILKNTSSSTYWSANILDQTGVNMGTVGPITVASGDQIHFRVNKRSNESNDSTIWDPKIVHTP